MADVAKAHQSRASSGPALTNIDNGGVMPNSITDASDPELAWMKEAINELYLDARTALISIHALMEQPLNARQRQGERTRAMEVLRKWGPQRKQEKDQLGERRTRESNRILNDDMTIPKGRVPEPDRNSERTDEATEVAEYADDVYREPTQPSQHFEELALLATQLAASQSHLIEQLGLVESRAYTAEKRVRQFEHILEDADQFYEWLKEELVDAEKRLSLLQKADEYKHKAGLSHSTQLEIEADCDLESGNSSGDGGGVELDEQDG